MRKLLSLGLALLMFLFIFPIAGFTETVENTEEENGEVIVLENFDEADEILGEDLFSTEPYTPENAEKYVFGNDDRVSVGNPSQSPFCAIAYMRCKAPCGDSWEGTGFMISRDRLLTASHCIFCPDHGVGATYIDFYFGYKNDKNYFYRYSGKWNALAGNSFPNHRYDSTDDFACVKFYENVGDRTGNFGCRFNDTDKTLESDYYYCAGYRHGVLKYAGGRLTVSDTDYLVHTIDMVAGNSGGPIFDRNHYAVGINITEGNSGNCAYRINQKVYNFFVKLG